MGGKSRKTGGVSLALIQRLKNQQNNLETNKKSSCGSKKSKPIGQGFFDAAK